MLLKADKQKCFPSLPPAVSAHLSVCLAVTQRQDQHGKETGSAAVTHTWGAFEQMTETCVPQSLDGSYSISGRQQT